MAGVSGEYKVIKPIFKDRAKRLGSPEEADSPRAVAIKRRMAKATEEKDTKTESSKAPFKY